MLPVPRSSSRTFLHPDDVEGERLLDANVQRYMHMAVMLLALLHLQTMSFKVSHSKVVPCYGLNWPACIYSMACSQRAKLQAPMRLPFTV